MCEEFKSLEGCGEKLLAAQHDKEALGRLKDGLDSLKKEIESYNKENGTLTKYQSHLETRLAETSEARADYDRAYKLFMSEPNWKTMDVVDVIYTSDDLIHWTKKENVFWGDGTEPLTSVFYNSHKQCHTIVERPFWGVRTVGQKTTTDLVYNKAQSWYGNPLPLNIEELIALTHQVVF